MRSVPRPRPKAAPPAAVLLATLAGCGGLADDLTCDTETCSFSAEEWARLEGLAGLGLPPPDRSNRLIGVEGAVQLGWRLYFDGELSGAATWVDTLGRSTVSARAPKGAAMGISCATCHDPVRAGADATSAPGHVSVGAGWYDVNGQQTVNAAYYDLLYWNGRSDSLWSQAAAVLESGVSMNGNRLAIAWTMADKYRASYDAIFTSSPLPLAGTSADVRMLLSDPAAGGGACASVPPACAPGCRAVSNNETGMAACSPRFPLRGKPGRKAGCQFGDASEPFGDAFDCMDDPDRAAVTQVLINASKAIAAYEFELRSRNAPFDRFVADGPDSIWLSDAAKRGARLFVGRASCVDCHNTPLFSDNRFHDIGVPQTGPAVPTLADCAAGHPSCDCVNGKGCLPWGWADGLAKLKSSGLRRDGAFSDDPTAGVALAQYYNLVASERQRFQWRTPSLRDVAVTGPYMHDGIYRTLEEVVWHYDQGGSASDGTGKAPELHPLFLSARDRADLVAFLKTLTGIYDRPDLHVAPPRGQP